MNFSTKGFNLFLWLKTYLYRKYIFALWPNSLIEIFQINQDKKSIHWDRQVRHMVLFWQWWFLSYFCWFTSVTNSYRDYRKIMTSRIKRSSRWINKRGKGEWEIRKNNLSEFIHSRIDKLSFYLTKIYLQNFF